MRLDLFYSFIKLLFGHQFIYTFFKLTFPSDKSFDLEGFGLERPIESIKGMLYLANCFMMGHLHWQIFEHRDDSVGLSFVSKGRL